jgi:NAD+ synthase (glutamine-hydrolysing)
VCSYNELLIPRPIILASDRDVIPIQAISTASNHELGGFDTCFILLQEAARESGGVILYSDQRGCGGDRTYSDGCAMIFVNGELVALGRQFSLEDVEVVTATVNLDDVEAFRPIQTHNNILLNIEASHELSIDYNLCSG